MNSTITRFAAGAAVAATVLGGALTAGAGVSSAADFGNVVGLDCYKNPGNSNPTRVSFLLSKTNIGIGFIYDGTGFLQQWNGSVYVNVPGHPTASVKGVGANAGGADEACRTIPASGLQGYVYGQFS